MPINHKQYHVSVPQGVYGRPFDAVALITFFATLQASWWHCNELSPFCLTQIHRVPLHHTNSNIIPRYLYNQRKKNTSREKFLRFAKKHFQTDFCLSQRYPRSPRFKVELISYSLQDDDVFNIYCKSLQIDIQII